MTGTLENVRFLVVDDNVHMLNIVKTILRGFGAAHVLEAKTPQEAFGRLKDEAIDIVILDYVMGEDDGVAFLKQLRNEMESPTPFVPVIMLTSHSEKRRVEAARDAGANEFCAKPVTPADLHRKIGMVIDHPRPFVRSVRYSGPDRRRRENPDYDGPERRRDPDAPSSDTAKG